MSVNKAVISQRKSAVAERMWARLDQADAAMIGMSQDSATTATPASPKSVASRRVSPMRSPQRKAASTDTAPHTSAAICKHNRTTISIHRQSRKHPHKLLEYLNPEVRKSALAIHISVNTIRSMVRANVSARSSPGKSLDLILKHFWRDLWKFPQI